MPLKKLEDWLEVSYLGNVSNYFHLFFPRSIILVLEVSILLICRIVVFCQVMHMPAQFVFKYNLERLLQKERHGYFELVGTEVLDKMSSRGPFQAQLFSFILLQTHKYICAEEWASLSLGFLASVSLQSPHPGRGILWSNLEVQRIHSLTEEESERRQTNKGLDSRTKWRRFGSNKSSFALVKFIPPSKQIPDQHGTKFLNTEGVFGSTGL